MDDKTKVLNRKESVLYEIVDRMELSERYLIQRYLKNEQISSEDYIRIKELECAMNNEKTHWWKSEHPQERAYRQFFCSTLILNFDIYRQDMQRLLRRQVYDSELFNREEIFDEVKEKYHSWKRIIISNANA